MSKLIKTDMKKALEKHLEDCNEKIRRKAYKEGYDQGKFDSQLTTPPTEQEVCEALGEYLGEEVTYIHYDDELDMMNLFYAEGRPIAYTNKVKSAVGIIKELVITLPLPPHLITMISKFYEGKVKE